jgi:hypothetical protein
MKTNLAKIQYVLLNFTNDSLHFIQTIYTGRLVNNTYLCITLQ